MSAFWQRAAVAAATIGVALVSAKLVDWRIARRNLPAETVTRYDVLRRSVVAAIVFVGIASALLVIPGVRAIAGGVLASSAVVGLVLGFASQRTIGNVVAGILIAVTQPLRLGDEVEIEGSRGVVEEIGLTYTWLRTGENDRVVVPNEKLASDTIRNYTIRSVETRAEAAVEVSSAGLRRLVEALAVDGDEVYVTGLSGDKATVVVRRWVSDERAAERAASDLRIALAEKLAAA
jgi:small-conductance mechanosensitive channel